MTTIWLSLEIEMRNYFFCMHALPCLTFQIFMLHKTSRQSLDLSTAFISASYYFKRSKPFLADLYYQNIK